MRTELSCEALDARRMMPPGLLRRAAATIAVAGAALFTTVCIVRKGAPAVLTGTGILIKGPR